MNTRHKSGAIRALLEEYQKALNELKNVIKDITPAQLITIVDPKTKDTNCKSIQSILSHIVSSGYSYSVYIRNQKGVEAKRPPKLDWPDINSYIKKLDDMFEYACETFQNIEDKEMESIANKYKILTKWGQVFDFDQMMEHAIVHILRHRRQIEGFKLLLGDM